MLLFSNAETYQFYYYPLPPGTTLAGNTVVTGQTQNSLTLKKISVLLPVNDVKNPIALTPKGHLIHSLLNI